MVEADAPPRTAKSGPAPGEQGAPLLPAGVVLTCLALAYALIAFHPGSWAYLDYVDGYYLYVAHRVAQGAVLYSGVMGVQPPGIYLVGALVFRVHDDLAAARLFSLLLHVATIALVYLACRRMSGSNGQGLLAALLYSLAPYSLVWSRTFDPNPLVTFLSLASFTLLLSGTPRGSLGAGLAGGLALATKVWYLPIGLVFVLFLARRSRRLLVIFLVGIALVVLPTAALGSLLAGGAFWRAMLVQDASQVSLAWLEASMVHVLIDDLPLLILALLGWRRTVWRGAANPWPARWYLLASCSVLGATIKSGTAWPVFQFAEPGLALWAALALLPAPVPAFHAARLFRVALGAGIVALWSLPAISAALPSPDGSERAVVALVRSRSRPDQALVAPPFYLYLSGRRAFGEFADVNLWALQAASGDHAALVARGRAEAAVRAASVPVVIEDSRVRRLGALDALLDGAFRRLDWRDPLPPDRAVTIWLPRR